MIPHRWRPVSHLFPVPRIIYKSDDLQVVNQILLSRAMFTLKQRLIWDPLAPVRALSRASQPSPRGQAAGGRLCPSPRLSPACAPQEEMNTWIQAISAAISSDKHEVPASAQSTPASSRAQTLPTSVVTITSESSPGRREKDKEKDKEKRFSLFGKKKYRET